MPLRISLVTPSFNQAKFIGKTIDSVLAQTGDFDLDYRIVDGGSTDGTLDILRSYGERIKWASERDDGQVDAVNKGLRTATGEIVGWLNSDDMLLPGALAKIAASFADPDVEWAHGRCVIIDEHDREVRRWISAYKHFRSRTFSYENLLTENYVSQMTAFWRRSAHDDVGYINGELQFAFDHDFFLRLARRSPPAYIEDRIACFRWYAASKSGTSYETQMRETAELATRHGANAWTKTRAQLKRLAVVNIYRAMSYARQLRG